MSARPAFIGLSACLLAVIASVGLTACTGPTTSTPAPTLDPMPDPPATSTVVWVADGVINSGEYSGSNTYGDYEVHWGSDSQHIYVGIRARTGGFVAVAVQPGTRMKDADMVFGFVNNGETTVYDLFSTGDFGPHPPDTELGGTDDILEFAGKEGDGFTVIEFKRSLDTGDRYDHPLTAGVNQIIWSYGQSDSLLGRHLNRGYGDITLN